MTKSRTTPKSIRAQAYQTIVQKITDASNDASNMRFDLRHGFSEEKGSEIAVLIRFANQCDALTKKQHTHVCRLLLLVSDSFQGTV